MHTNCRPFPCKLCPKTFRTHANLRNHQRTHTRPQSPPRGKGNSVNTVPESPNADASESETYFSCKVCPYKTVYRSDVTKHMRSHTDAKCFKCDFCDFATAWKKNLKVHRMRHTGEKPYKCKECDFATHDGHILRSHSLVHSKAKAFICEVCGSAFAQQKFLHQHQVVHTGAKPYKCTECDYATGFRTNLRSHKLMHAERKGYVCELCGKECRQKGHLVAHQRNCHSDPDKVYTCTQCGFQATQSQSFNSHMRKHKNKSTKCNTTLKASTTAISSNSADLFSMSYNEQAIQSISIVQTSPDGLAVEATPGQDLQGSDMLREFQDQTGHTSFCGLSSADQDPVTLSSVVRGDTGRPAFLPEHQPSIPPPEPQSHIPQTSISLPLSLGSSLEQPAPHDQPLPHGQHIMQQLTPGKSDSAVNEEHAVPPHELPDQLGQQVGAEGPYGQASTPLLQYDGMAAVLSIIRDFTYQSQQNTFNYQQ